MTPIQRLQLTMICFSVVMWASAICRIAGYDWTGEYCIGLGIVGVLISIRTTRWPR